MESPHRDIPDDINYKQSISLLPLLYSGLLVWTKSIRQAIQTASHFFLDRVVCGISGICLLRFVYNRLLISGIESNFFNSEKYHIDKKTFVKQLHEKNHISMIQFACVPLFYTLYFVIVFAFDISFISFGLSCGVWGMVGFTALSGIFLIITICSAGSIYESEMAKKNRKTAEDRASRCYDAR